MAQATHRLTGVDVRYISLAGRPKNGRSMVLKADGDGEVVVMRETQIVKADPMRQMAYGVVYAPDDVDADGHTMSAGEIEKAMLGFMAKGRVGAVDTDHDEQTGGAYVAESWLVKADDGGLTVDATFPGEAAGTWVVGIKVEDAATWDRIEKGDITGLSFAGVAAVEQIAVEAVTEAGGVAKSVPSGEPVDATGERAVESLLSLLIRKAREVVGIEAEAEAGAGADAGAEVEPVVASVAEAEAGAEVEAPPPADVAKSFAAILLRSRLWETTSALGEALRAAMEQTETPVRVAVEAVLGEYHAWLLANLGDAEASDAEAGVEKAGEERKKAPRQSKDTRGGGRGRHDTPFSFDRSAPGADAPGADVDAEPDAEPAAEPDDTLTLDAVRDVVTSAVAPLAARLDAMEKQTPGRQSALGDDVQKAAPRRGLQLFG